MLILINKWRFFYCSLIYSNKHLDRDKGKINIHITQNCGNSNHFSIPYKQFPCFKFKKEKKNLYIYQEYI